jgi:hypothetical protein
MPVMLEPTPLPNPPPQGGREPDVGTPPLPNPSQQGGREWPSAQSLTSQLVGAGVLGASNVATGQIAGADVNLLAMSLNLIGQIVKQHPRFDQNRWLVPVLLACGIGLAWVLWQDGRQALLRGAAAAYQSLNNYRGQHLMGLGVLAPAPEGR